MTYPKDIMPSHNADSWRDTRVALDIITWLADARNAPDDQLLVRALDLVSYLRARGFAPIDRSEP